MLKDEKVIKELLDIDHKDDISYGDDEPNFEMQLIEAGWNVIVDNPGIEVEEWICELMRLYPTEVVDALGTNPLEVFDTLRDWWEYKEYTDTDTGEWNTLCGWSEYYATDPDHALVRLERANKRIKELEDEIKLCKAKISRLEALKQKG